MANKPHSEALRETIATLDISISEAKQLHDAAVIASREAIAVNIAIIADSGASEFFDAGDIVVPDTTSTSARLTDLLQKREVAEDMLARALESERLAKDASDRAALSAKLNRLDDQAKLIDAATIALADVLASFDAAANEVQNHIRFTMGRTPIAGIPTIDTAKAVAAYIGQCANWNPAPHQPAAAIRADGFARNARNAAGDMA